MSETSPFLGIVSGERRHTHADVAARADRIASGLAEIGVKQGDCVCMLMRNDTAFLEAAYAAMRLGAYGVPINWHFKPEEINYILRDSGTSVLIGHADLLHPLRGAVPAGVTVLSVPPPPEILASYRIDPDLLAPPDFAIDLESWLGARLLNRTTRRLSLTEIGTAFYERAARILEAVEEAKNAAGALQTTPRGRLRINAPVSFGLLHLAPVVTDFLQRFPDVSVELLVNDRLVDLLEGEFDVGVRIGRLRDSSLIARRIALTGPISLADFMAEALSHPRLGYYRHALPVGAAGDFTTAPEISQMFGELLGAWLAERWLAMGRPPSVRLVELGPGRGTLIGAALGAVVVNYAKTVFTSGALAPNRSRETLPARVM